MVSFPISHRTLMKLLLCGCILAFASVGVGGITDDKIDVAVQLATATLEREMTSLKEQLELFDMKHETLQAASEQFRLQSKNAKNKLDEERKRYDILASQKQSMEMNIESKLAFALEEQKATFEDTVTADFVKKRDLLLKENEELSESLRRAEIQLQLIEESVKETVKEQSKRSEISEGKRLASEGNLRNQITDLKNRLSYSEEQAKSFEESWKIVVAESEVKDELFQLESEKRLKEASRWAQRLQKLNAESKDLFEDNTAKEMELLRSKRLHLTLLEKLQDSDDIVQEQEAKIKTFTDDVEKLSNDLDFASSELNQSKKDHSSLFDRFENLSTLHNDTKLMLKSARVEGRRTVAKNEQLQSELVDLKFELETSQNKTKQTIEEKSEMTKAYTEALEQLTLKNNLLRHDLIDIRFELEESQNETVTLKKNYFETTNAHKNALERLQSEERKLKFLQNEYSTLEESLEAMTDEFHKSEIKVKNFHQRIVDEETTSAKLQKELLYNELKLESSQKNLKDQSDKNSLLSYDYEEVKRSLESSDAKLLEAKRQYQRSQEHAGILQNTLDELERKVEEMAKQLDLKVAKNSYLQKSLLDTKFDLEESQTKAELLEARLTETSTSDEQFTNIETANAHMIQRAKDLERRLEESSTLYDNATRRISDLQSQLNATETKSAQVLNMLESMKEENIILSRSLNTSEDHKTEFNTASQALQEKTESFEQCGNDLRDSQVEFSKLKEDYHVAKVKIHATEAKVLLQEDAINELKKRQVELENIADHHEKELQEYEKSNSPEYEGLTDVKSDTVEVKPTAAAEETKSKTNKNVTETTEGTTKSETAAVKEDVKDAKDAKDSASAPGPNERETQKRSRSSFFSFLGWLDYALYTILRVVVDLVGFLGNSVWQILSSSSLFAPLRSFFDLASWTMNELRIIHDALVSLFEFEMTFVSSLVSSETDRSGFVFLIRHSELFVMFGEAIGVLLCIDFFVSSFLNPIRARKRRPRAKSIPVPKTATASLLRKANNM